mmetsp:Transcript_7794/g.13789  ORF Transcript_7794/g.13789 Transcript_7794/m.13789 type:complete len:234 (+) Transcript_7794:288-989(+)
MRIVLLEASYSSQTGQGTRRFVAVQHAEIGHTDGQLTIRAVLGSKNQTMARAVHRLESKLAVFHREAEHVLPIVLRMPRSFPQSKIVHIGRIHLQISTLPVFIPQKLHQRIVNSHAMRQKERRSGAQRMEHEQLLVLTDQSVIALGSFLQEHLVLFQELGIRERDAVHSLQRRVFRLSEPVGLTDLGHGHGLDSVRVRYVRPAAEINKRSVPVCGNGGSLLQLLDELHLKLVV